jgi:hypothetical protein
LFREVRKSHCANCLVGAQFSRCFVAATEFGGQFDVGLHGSPGEESRLLEDEAN